MLGIRKRNKHSSKLPEKQRAVVLPLYAANRSLGVLVELIDKIRPDNPKDIEQAEWRFKVQSYQLDAR